jgi:hypothetical protein
MDQDILYHLALGSESHDLVSMFGDVKVTWQQGNNKHLRTVRMYLCGSSLLGCGAVDGEQHRQLKNAVFWNAMRYDTYKIRRFEGT